MRLSELIDGLEVVKTLNFADREISGVQIDSRKVGEGDIFIAVTGHSLDGHDYAAAAAQAGAAALVCEKQVEAKVPVVIVPDSNAAEAHVARNFYGDPGSHLKLFGITGTNGKTSSAYILRSILEAAGWKSGLIGTIGYGSRRDMKTSDQTTPSSSMIYRLLAGFVAEGCDSAVMEVSSHAAVQGRTRGIEFDTGIFTNITRDHLDYHETIEKYAAAKELFASSLVEEGRKKAAGTLIYNLDDPQVKAIGERFKGPKVSYGKGDMSMVGIEDLKADMSGTRFTLRTPDSASQVRTRLLGSFAAYNAAAAAAAAWSAHLSLEQIRSGLESVEQVPGRFQVTGGGEVPTVVIDYAHTPDALENILRFCRELGPEKLITVFGAGGDRDRGKRPMMGSIASKLSDLVYVTSDNPRSEDPEAIIQDVLEGTGDGGAEIKAEADRGRAIADAVSAAGPKDLVVIAGKGHEDYQITKEGKTHFSDMEEAVKALERLGAGHRDRT